MWLTSRAMSNYALENGEERNNWILGCTLIDCWSSLTYCKQRWMRCLHFLTLYKSHVNYDVIWSQIARSIDWVGKSCY